ncbi:hypothetical protein COOONC_21592 [Cooperia oncophora]
MQQHSRSSRHTACWSAKLAGLAASSYTGKQNLNLTIPPNKDRKYSRQAMVIIGAQHEIARRESLSAQGASTVPIIHPSLPPPDVQVGSIVIKCTVVVRANFSRKLSILYRLDVWVTLVLRRVPSWQGNFLVYRNGRRLCQVERGLRIERYQKCPMKTGECQMCVYRRLQRLCTFMEMKNCRAAMGQLKVMTDGNRNWALFSPTDSRMPRMMIPADQLPSGFFERPQDFAKFIFVARMVEWQATAQFARGKLERTLGVAGDVEAETEGLLFANNVDTREFSLSVMHCLPIFETKQWTIDEVISTCILYLHVLLMVLFLTCVLLAELMSFVQKAALE